MLGLNDTSRRLRPWARGSVCGRGHNQQGESVHFETGLLGHVQRDLGLCLCLFLAQLFGEIDFAAGTLVRVDERGSAHESEWTEFDVEADREIAAGLYGVMEGLVGNVAEAANLDKDEWGRASGEREQT